MRPFSGRAASPVTDCRHRGIVPDCVGVSVSVASGTEGEVGAQAMEGVMQGAAARVELEDDTPATAADPARQGQPERPQPLHADPAPVVAKLVRYPCLPAGWR